MQNFKKTNNILPLISIIVPNYNHSNYLRQRLECIFNQTYPNFEVILLDDCSSDRSQEIILEYVKNSKVSHRVFNDANSGNTFLQWKKGIELAKGDYIWIAESDDFCELHFLEELIQPVLQNPEIKLVYCQSNRADQFGNITGSWLNHTDDLDAALFLTNFVMEGNEFIERFLIRKNVIPNASGVLFSKKDADRLGEFDIDPFLKTCGDWLFYIKLVTNGKVAFVSKSLNNFRYHKDSVIAKAYDKGEFNVNRDVEINIRKKINVYFTKEKSNNSTIILKTNNKIINEIKYRKAHYLIKNNKKFKGVLILFSIFSLTINKSVLIRKLKNRLILMKNNL